MTHSTRLYRPERTTKSVPLASLATLLYLLVAADLTRGTNRFNLCMGLRKRLRILLSENNAGIDDVLLGGIIHSRFTEYDLVRQWTSYGWNVFQLENGNDYAQILRALTEMDQYVATMRTGLGSEERGKAARTAQNPSDSSKSLLSDSSQG